MQNLQGPVVPLFSKSSESQSPEFLMEYRSDIRSQSSLLTILRSKSQIKQSLRCQIWVKIVKERHQSGLKPLFSPTHPFPL